MTAIVAFNQLYAELGTWAEVEKATGIKDRLRRKIMHELLRAGKCTPAIRRRLTRALRKYSRFPLSNDFLQRSRERLTELKSEPGSYGLESYIFVFDKYLKSTKPKDKQELLEYKYMKVLVELAKALQHGDDDNWFGGVEGSVASLQAAEQNAEEGIALADILIEETTDIQEQKRINQLRAFLFINWMQTKQEQTKSGFEDKFGHVKSRAELSDFFSQKRAFQELDSIIIEYPFLWQAIYNGLEQASYVQNYGYALYFYRKLIKLDHNFKNFEYNPGEVLPLSKEPGMVYFVKWFNQKFRADRSEKTQGANVNFNKMGCAMTITTALVFVTKMSCFAASVMSAVGTGV